MVRQLLSTTKTFRVWAYGTSKGGGIRRVRKQVVAMQECSWEREGAVLVLDANSSGILIRKIAFCKAFSGVRKSGF